MLDRMAEDAEDSCMPVDADSAVRLLRLDFLGRECINANEYDGYYRRILWVWQEGRWALGVERWGSRNERNGRNGDCLNSDSSDYWISRIPPNPLKGEAELALAH